MKTDDKKEDQKPTKSKSDVEVIIDPEDSQEDIDEAISYSERKKRGRNMRRFKRRLQVGKRRQSRRKATKSRLNTRSRRKAIDAVRRRVAGKKGANYKSLSVGQKMSIDKRVHSRKKAINRIAKKLMPKVRRADNAKFSKKRLNEAFGFFLEECSCEKKPVKRFHELLNKDKSVKHDMRFKRYKNVKEDMDTLEEIKGLFEEIELSEKHYKTAEELMVKKALEALHRLVTKKGAKQTIGGYAFDIARSFNLGLNSKQLAKKYEDEYGLPEGMESFDANDLFEDTCSIVGHAQLKKLEAALDKIGKKHGLDFEFTKHFGERMSHERNNPCITIKELAGFLGRVLQQGKVKLFKDNEGREIVLNDLQKHLNIPIVIKHDKKNNELDIVHKTIMRKKDFKSPDKKIGIK